MQKFIAVIVLIIAIIAVALLVTSSQDAQNNEGEQTENDTEALLDSIDGNTNRSDVSGAVHTMVLGENGYEPRNITIEVGDIITFSTTLNKPFWPASDVHPTHRIFSEFDPKQPVQPEDTWSFTFQKAGTWGYHDHIAPFHTGTITVVAP